MEEQPLVSVVMTVYNGELYLRKAIDSILNQTYKSIEFIIIDDGSTDNSKEILKSYQDKRINLVFNKENMGLPSSLNKGFSISNGKYIARMDSDDISMKNRIEKQVNFMEKNHEVDICGTWVKVGRKIKGINIPPYRRKYPLHTNAIQITLLFDSPLVHPTVMFRTDTLRKYHISYNERFRYAQDIELWRRVCTEVHIVNIPYTLLYYRINPSSQARKNESKRLNFLFESDRYYFKKLGVELNEEEHMIHRNHYFNQDVESLLQVENWYKKLLNQIKKQHTNDLDYIARIVVSKWMLACESSGLGLKALSTYLSSNLAKEARMPLRNYIVFIIKSIVKWNKNYK